MTEILLAKPQLDSSWVDLSVGEATLVRNNLLTHFPSLQDPSLLTLNSGVSMQDLEYQSPAGYPPLVELLEARHQAPVVITNGAKQGLAASFYALHKKDRPLLWMQPIHWALLPPLAIQHQLEPEYLDPIQATDKLRGMSAYLLLAPNNPDNDILPYSELQDIERKLNAHKAVLIHDAAYYTHSYLPDDYPLGPLGSVQIFSFSKMLGLSSLRGGYVVCYDKSFYRDLVEYQEMMTVGVSILTQKFLLAVLQKMKTNPETTLAFERANFAALKEAKHLMKEVPDSILTVSEEIERTAGMFCWAKLHNKEAFKKARIHIVGGEPFGDASMVRLNLGLEKTVLQECVKRLQEVVS